MAQQELSFIPGRADRYVHTVKMLLLCEYSDYTDQCIAYFLENTKIGINGHCMQISCLPEINTFVLSIYIENSQHRCACRAV